MTISETLLLDFDVEAQSTRRVLERVPQEQADWKPHDRSMTLGQIAGHVGSLVDFGRVILTTSEFDLSAKTAPRYVFTTTDDAVKYAAGGAGQVRSALASLTDEAMMQTWTLTFQGKTVTSMPRAIAYRAMFFNHLIHHRGQLSVYLRLLDVKVPGIYGPSADEPFGM